MRVTRGHYVVLDETQAVLRADLDWARCVVPGAKLIVAFVIGIFQGYEGTDCLRYGATLARQVTKENRSTWHEW